VRFSSTFASFEWIVSDSPPRLGYPLTQFSDLRRNTPRGVGVDSLVGEDKVHPLVRS
jgi:hypothetical protein